ncbi:hypothetical protein PN465_11365 [Nodularia spumigena CS-584]|uniref:hypothetical protein n=1 Tax=Nodularia spumigena TaxID=70799 RepID=UPI0000EA9288|nr:hypothetical protein [Nodularia spumigena]AHJ28608.1 hypothetical protein NSP_22760 [Nodularia spumigena CCY9414]EAW43019.1 hypothetical protein N9414_06479 [Nodularia spumigena CCY9414]MDB9382815.1 hypothetical protein [Nodularia spumigena CS-584]
MLSHEYSILELGVDQQALGINPIPQTLAEWLKSFEIAIFIRQPVTEEERGLRSGGSES